MNKFVVKFFQDLVPGEVNRPSGCSQCTRCNAEEPEIPGQKSKTLFPLPDVCQKCTRST